MRKLSIEFNHGLHAGGTKSYQVWKIGAGDRWFVIHQWGKAGVCLAGSGHGGQNLTYTYNDESSAAADTRSIMGKKRARGYQFGKWQQHKPGAGRTPHADPQDMLMRVFGAQMAGQIWAHVGSVLEIGREEEMVTESFTPDSTSHADWGSW